MSSNSNIGEIIGSGTDSAVAIHNQLDSSFAKWLMYAGGWALPVLIGFWLLLCLFTSGSYFGFAKVAWAKILVFANSGHVNIAYTDSTGIHNRIAAYVAKDPDWYFAIFWIKGIFASMLAFPVFFIALLRIAKKSIVEGYLMSQDEHIDGIKLVDVEEFQQQMDVIDYRLREDKNNYIEPRMQVTFNVLITEPLSNKNKSGMKRIVSSVMAQM